MIQLGFPWILDYEKNVLLAKIYKTFLSTFKRYRRIRSFLFLLFRKLVYIITKQNAQRAICESYISLLEHEGRLHTDFECLLCEIVIEDDLSLVRGFYQFMLSVQKQKILNLKKKVIIY